MFTHIYLAFIRSLRDCKIPAEREITKLNKSASEVSTAMSLPVSLQPRFQKSERVLPGWKTKLEMPLTQMFEKNGSKIKNNEKN